MAFYRLLHQKFFAVTLLLAFTLTLHLSIIPPSQTVLAAGKTYYVSQSTGNDSWAGTKSKPWKTLKKASTITYHKGDTLLLKCGDTWTGEVLSLKSKGDTTFGWAVVSSYDSPAKGRPIINGKESSIYVYQCYGKTGWKIMNIELGHAKMGIFVQNSILEGMLIQNCYIHDMTGLSKTNSEAGQNASCGIRITQGYIKNLTIKNNIVNRCDMGIAAWGIDQFLFDHCSISSSGYCAVELLNAYNGTIQNCKFLHSGLKGAPWGTTAVGFMHTVENVVLKDSEIAYTVAPNYHVDGCGVDYEGASKNVTTTNCYIHDNYGRAFLVMATAGDCIKSNITNNLCVNNGYDPLHYEPAFLLLFDNKHNGGTISGNKIVKAYPTQRIIADDSENLSSGFRYINNKVYEKGANVK